MKSRHTNLSRTRGFTLMEILVAIAIFAVVSVLALTGYNELIKQREHASASMARVRAVQRTVTRMTQDFEQLEPRPIRDATAATTNAALLATTGGTTLAEFTRAGWTNPAGVSRSTEQRVAYRIVNGELFRDYWTVLDRTLNSTPVETKLLDKVKTVTLRFMDKNRQWQTVWPSSISATGASGSNADLPKAVEITLTLEDWGEIKRLIEVAG
jgi:general secretion pathway protein J